MEFRNQTPFDALAFEGVDTQDREYHIVVLSASYTLQRVAETCDWTAVPDDGRSGFPALPLTLADEHWGDPVSTSLKRESDLVPYKPKCDVRWVGVAHAGPPVAEFRAWMAIRQGDDIKLEKSLLITGPCEFIRVGERETTARVGDMPNYRLSSPRPTSAVPLQYEYAFGGSCRLDATVGGEPGLHEVCYRNPLGRGWWARSYVDALLRSGGPWPDRLPAPQIWNDAPMAEWIVTPQSGSKNAIEMGLVHYPVMPAGFGPLGKAWAPRLALAGTYDDSWLEERHPDLPRDFDFNFWNGAPADMQIDFPDVAGAGVLMAAGGLTPAGGLSRWRIPPHRAYALMRLDDGLVLPNPMQIDLIEVDNSDPTTPPRLRLVWRTAVLKQAAPRVLEARFEMDPAAPLLKLRPSANYEHPSLSLTPSRS